MLTLYVTTSCLIRETVEHLSFIWRKWRCSVTAGHTSPTDKTLPWSSCTHFRTSHHCCSVCKCWKIDGVSVLGRWSVFINVLSVFLRPNCTSWWQIKGFWLRRRWFGKVCIMLMEMGTSVTQSFIWGRPLTQKRCTVVSRTRSIRSGLDTPQECSVLFSHKHWVLKLFLRVMFWKNICMALLW